jgi:RNA polymerase sigma factor (sigma-70 family)
VDHTDTQLIEDYCQGDSVALATLIRRHIDLVYASALRRTGDPGIADDITQAVFIILSKKVRSLRHRATIAGWLIVVTRHVTRAALRAKVRRQQHERAAAKGEVADMNFHAECEQAEVARVLDDALAGLSTSDRDAIVLRYLEASSFVDIGKSLGISEEAARKRVDRGLGRLRTVLSHHSVFLEAVALSEVVAKLATKPAPIGVTEAVARNQAGRPMTHVISISNEVFRMFLFKKLGVAVAVIALMIGAIAGISVLAQNSDPVIAAAPTLPTTQPASAIQHMVIQLPVRNVQANIEFFERLGFHLAAQDAHANEPLKWATVESGMVRFRMIVSDDIPRVGSSFVPYFFVDGGLPALRALHNDLASRGVAVANIDMGTTPHLTLEMRDGHLQPPPVKNPVIGFDVRTPDGYTVGFMTVRDWPPQ